jgi:hypothetical protein
LKDPGASVRGILLSKRKKNYNVYSVAFMDKLKAVPEGITVARFRDLVEGNRKTCLPLLELFDAEGITERRGDVRVITEKGKALTC